MPESGAMGERRPPSPLVAGDASPSDSAAPPAVSAVKGSVKLQPTDELIFKLYDKYQNLKKRKLLEEDWDGKRGADFREYDSSMQDLLEALKDENKRLFGELSTLSDQHAKIEKLLLQENQKCVEYKRLLAEVVQRSEENEKLLLEETRKAKELSNEVSRLQNLISNNVNVRDNTFRKSPAASPMAASEELALISSAKKVQKSISQRSNVEMIVGPVASRDHFQEPKCCRRKIEYSGKKDVKSSFTCVYQVLMEIMVDMNFSIIEDVENVGIAVSHERSGFSFGLTWTRNDRGEGEWVYSPYSLGTVEKIVTYWMKEEIAFSMSMLPVFFHRVSRIIGPR